MAENIIELILKLKDQASSGVTSFAGKFRAGIAECQAATTALDSSINGVVKSLAGIATAGAISLGLTDVVKGGLASLDNTKMTAIGIASMLTGLADQTSGDLMAIYKNNLAYAQDMMAQIKAEAAKPSHFALPGEMIEAFRMVSQKGVVLTSDQDVETLAQMTDYIKILHGGQADAVTIATELRSVMEGQVMRGAQLARLMEQQLGPDWAELVEKARRAGTLMELLRKVSVGVALAAGDIGTAMITQASSLQATIGSIKSGGMKEAYDDVVSAMVQIDALLKAHKAEIIGGIRAGWRGFRDLVKEAWSYIQMIAQFSAENPTLTAMTKDALLLAAGISAAASMIRVFGGVASWIFGAVASLMSPIVTIISKLGSGLGSLLSAALKLNPAFGAIVIVLLAIGVAIAGWKLADVIGEWQIAGLKIKEYVELAKLYLDNFCIYLSTDFAQEVNTAFSNMGDSIVNAFANALAKAQVQLTTWAQSVWKWIKEWNDDPNPFGISWAGPSTRGSTTSAGVEAIPPEGDEAMLKAREAANKARIKEIQEAGAQRRATGVESDDKGATDKPSHTKPKINIKESQDGGKGGSGGAKQTAEAELALAKAVAAHKVALVEQEQAAVELAYQQGQMSAEEFYAQLQRLNGAELNARLEGLQEEKNAIQKGLSEEMSAAKSGEQASAVRTRADAKLLAIEDQIAKAKSESAKKTVELAEQERRAIQDRASATANALTTMLDEEQISADQRQSIASRLLAAQIKEIRAEALEVEKKTAGAVKAEEYAAAKIKALQQDLRGYSLQQLEAMLADEATSLQQRERIWKQIEDRIKAGEVSTWQAMRLGFKQGFENFSNTAQNMAETWKQAVSDFNSEFKTAFGKLFKGELESVEDIFDAFCDALTNVFANALSKMASDWITSGLGNLLGNLFGGLFGDGSTSSGSGGNFSYNAGNVWGFHSGGVIGADVGTLRMGIDPLVFAGARRLHSGLAADEYPAILQGGEEVVSRSDRATILSELRASRKAATAGAGGGAGAGNAQFHVSIDNQSSTPVKAEQGNASFDGEKYVLGIVLKDYSQGGSIWKMIRGKK